MGTLKPQINGPLYSNMVTGTVPLAVDGWAVTFATARRALGGLQPAPVPSRCTKCNSPPINGNFILFDVALLPVPIKGLIITLKPQSNGASYSNTVIGTLAVDGWAVTFGTTRRVLGGAAARPGPSSLYQM